MHNSASSFAYSKGGGQPPPLTKTSQLATAAFCVYMCVCGNSKETNDSTGAPKWGETNDQPCLWEYLYTYICSHIVRVCPQSKFVSCQQIFIQCNRFVDFKLFNFPLAQLGE